MKIQLTISEHSNVLTKAGLKAARVASIPAIAMKMFFAPSPSMTKKIKRLHAEKYGK